MSFESLAATAESLNINDGVSKFSAAARILLPQNNFPLRAIWPEPAVVKPTSAAIDDTRPLGYEWHIDDKVRRVRRSLRIIYMKEQDGGSWQLTFFLYVCLNAEGCCGGVCDFVTCLARY